MFTSLLISLALSQQDVQGIRASNDYKEAVRVAAIRHEEKLTREWTVDGGTDKEKKFTARFTALTNKTVTLSRKGKDRNETVEVALKRLSKEDRKFAEGEMAWRKERAERLKEFEKTQGKRR